MTGTQEAHGIQDDVDAALEQLTVSLRLNIDRMERAIKRAEMLREERAAGKSWREIVSAEERPMLLELLGENLEELYRAGGRLRRCEARALYDEGLSMEQVARLFGVTRQRISALLKAGGRTDVDIDLAAAPDIPA